MREHKATSLFTEKSVNARFIYIWASHWTCFASRFHTSMTALCPRHPRRIGTEPPRPLSLLDAQRPRKPPTPPARVSRAAAHAAPSTARRRSWRGAERSPPAPAARPGGPTGAVSNAGSVGQGGSSALGGQTRPVVQGRAPRRVHVSSPPEAGAGRGSGRCGGARGGERREGGGHETLCV